MSADLVKSSFIPDFISFFPWKTHFLLPIPNKLEAYYAPIFVAAIQFITAHWMNVFFPVVKDGKCRNPAGCVQRRVTRALPLRLVQAFRHPPVCKMAEGVKYDILFIDFWDPASSVGLMTTYTCDNLSCSPLLLLCLGLQTCCSLHQNSWVRYPALGSKNECIMISPTQRETGIMPCVVGNESRDKVVDKVITSWWPCTVFLVGCRAQDPNAGHGGSWLSRQKHWQEQEGNWALCEHVTQSELQRKHKVQRHLGGHTWVISFDNSGVPEVFKTESTSQSKLAWLTRIKQVQQI